MRRLLLALLMCAPLTAGAISRHDKPVPKAIRNGFRFTLVVRSEGLSHTRPFLGFTRVSRPLRSNPGNLRAYLERNDKSLVAMEFDEVSGLSGVHELEFTVHYGQGNRIQSGDELDVYTAWRGQDNPKPIHYFGVFEGTGVTTITAP